MSHNRTDVWLVLAALAGLLVGAGAGRGGELPPWLPCYEADIDLDVAHHQAHVSLQATWTNYRQRPTRELVFNAHSRYIVPKSDIGLMAKTLELLRMNPSDAMGETEPACDIRQALLVGDKPEDLPVRYVGDTKTTLVLALPRDVAPGESITVVLDIVLHLPQKQGRWGQWCGVTFLSNWLPVFAVYDDHPPAPPRGRPAKEMPDRQVEHDPCWQPTPFIPWHQPFFNEAGNYSVRVTLPCDQRVACSGSVVATTTLDDGRKRVDIEAQGVRDFAFLCSACYQAFEGEVKAGPDGAPIQIHILAFPEHAHFAKAMIRIVSEALDCYGKWFGPYPYADFTIAESFFGWNGNECATLVMIDERVFGMPHLAGGYVDYLVSHEVCHQWWYNLVGTNGYCETFMDEAMATYFSHRLLDRKVGKNNQLMDYPKVLSWLPNIRRDDYRTYGMYGTIGRGDNGPIVQEMPGFGHVVNLFSMCYDKGSRVLGMIEARLSRGGDDVAFLDFVRCLYKKYRYRILRVADFQRELEAYTGESWEEFFDNWLYKGVLSDWAVEGVDVLPPAVPRKRVWRDWRFREAPPSLLGDTGDCTRVLVTVRQCGEYNEETCLGIALAGREGYPIRIPIVPQAGSYRLDDPPAAVQVLPDNRVRVEVLLSEEPVQIAVDPDQVLIDKNPANNYWKTPVRWRFTPLYTFLEETDLTNAYDRWNFLFGPWIYGPAYDDVWYTRSTMIGLRAGAYRTQEFSGGVYGAYRTDFRDFVVGVDGLLDHWPDSHFQVGYNVERRLHTFYDGDNNALRGVAFGRYIFQYGSSLYLPPMHYLEGFASYQENFLPLPKNPIPGGERYDQLSTLGLHYRLDYLTPYWDPEGGFRLDVTGETGGGDLDKKQYINTLAAQFSTVKSVPDFSCCLSALPRLQETARPFLLWLADTRLAFRAYGATGLPTRGEFFTLGGELLFRGYDQAQRQGSTVWVGSVEWRVPLARGLKVDAADHVFGLRNVYGAAFYDIGDAYAAGHSQGPVAHAVGGGLRFDVSWFGFVERTTLRIDVAKTVNDNTPVQFLFGVSHPF
jgi:hypothetical protein